MDNDWNSVWNIINTGGVIAVLFTNVVLLLRGDILPRRVYEELTTNILDKLCNKILDGIKKLLHDELNGGTPGAD